MIKIKSLYKRYSSKIRDLKYRELINSVASKNFSIFTSDCIGGILYHDFHKQFTSPTINLYFSESNYSFLNFCLDPFYYLKKELIFLKEQDFPRAIIKGDKKHKDIQINFKHYLSDQEALESWNRRSSRICNNMLFIYLKFELDNRDAELIDKIDNIFVITSIKTNLKILENKKVHVSKYLSKLTKNNGKIMSFYGLRGMRNFDDLNLMEFIKENVL